MLQVPDKKRCVAVGYGSLRRHQQAFIEWVAFAVTDVGFPKPIPNRVSRYAVEASELGQCLVFGMIHDGLVSTKAVNAHYNKETEKCLRGDKKDVCL